MSDAAEVWKVIDDYPNYEVSNKGNVRNRITLKQKGFRLFREGYLYCGLYKNNTEKHKMVHHLVTNAFMRPLPAGYVRNHINGDKRNNTVENLEFVTRRENTTHSRKHTKYKTGVRPSNGKFTSCVGFYKKPPIYLGTFLTEEEAHQAYVDKLKELGLRNKYAAKDHFLVTDTSPTH